MNSIGFNNFRKFTEFPTIQFGGITLLVGANNSGKSTLVKALLLMRDFLTQKVIKKDQIFESLTPDFRFDSNYIHIGSFKRAFCNKCSDEETTMRFTTGIGQFSFEVKVDGDRAKESALPHVSELTIVDHVRAVQLAYNYSSNLMSATFLPNEETKEKNQKIDLLKQQLLELKQRQAEQKDFNEIIKLKDEINSIDAKIRAIGEEEEEKELSVSFDMAQTLDVVGGLLIPELVRQFAKYAEQGTTGDESSARYIKEKSDKTILKGKSSLINAMATDLEYLLSFDQVEYIYAHSASQQVLYNMKDSNDFLSKTIHEYYMSRISEGDAEYLFIKKWMDIFDLGHSFQIESVAGEAYQVRIIDTDNDSVQLADKGMGAIQMMILLLRLATLIRKYKGATTPVTVLVEEPEQNLHPASQSLLADLFLEVNLEYGCHFIVETHSEYLIRRSQVLVATLFGTKDSFINNPFVTFYMPKHGIPYSMSYNENGRFEEKFGEGFFDEAGKSNMTLIKKERGLV